VNTNRSSSPAAEVMDEAIELPGSTCAAACAWSAQPISDERATDKPSLLAYDSDTAPRCLCTD
jgi:hypothetical protein